MAVDWVGQDFHGPVKPPPGSALRVTFLKLTENLDDGVKSEILGVIKGIKDSFGQINQISCGENFSPAGAKGYSIASLAVFPGVGEIDAVDSNQELLDLQKEKVRDYWQSVVVVDYVVPLSQSASLFIELIKYEFENVELKHYLAAFLNQSCDVQSTCADLESLDELRFALLFQIVYYSH
ncbi:hypothetical protein FNV43_RR17943 [Rhamnella rubrinervis]|uniref:Stress-response A/B barrel domain-containing protein n=1 Tax=Rhamnella rubrinervis TaxID=2594499 RepID=A0A8K0E595_9ROSA|nr:hypothetical protein FNV43_RR17943 [Rhamnella rubrinervis]